MSINDVKAVRDNWRPFHDDLVGYGCNIFAELFKLNDAYQDMFSGIRECGDVNMSNPKLREHAVRVMTAFDSWVIALNDTPVLEGLLLRQGRDHIPRKVFRQHFTDMKKAISTVMSNTLGAKFNRSAFDTVYEKRILAQLMLGQEG